MSIARFLLATFLVLSIVSIGGGCGDTSVKLADVPQLRPAAPVLPQDQPKNLRPGSGSSAGMTRDPNGGPGGGNR